MSTSPYPGLRPFHRDEADIFFGRDEQVDQLLNRLGKSRFLAVVGPSGCGKSSLVHTGLLNALEAGFLADAGLHWRIATMQPGSHPMRTLAEALVEHIGPDTDRINTSTSKDRGVFLPLPSGEGRGEGFQNSTNPNPPSESDNTALSDTGTPTTNETPRHDDTAFLLSTLRRGPLGLIEALQEQPLPENTNLLLVVDQFEEIFRYREHQDRDEADAFVALLLRSVMDSEFPVYIVITMRSDFLGDCALFPGLPETLNDSQFLTPRLNREQRRLVITGPTKVCGGDVEPALVNRLLNDMGADPDQLPVLQHALMRLWAEAVKRDNKPVLLKLNDYEALGGWDNTLSNHANEAFAELDNHQQTIAEKMFRALTERSGPRRDTRRPVSLQTVANVAGVDIAQVIPVIEVFRRADRSFVMPPEGQPLTAETLIDISHESLIRQWRLLKEWVELEAQTADTYRRLEDTALRHSQKRAGLLQGLDLFSALEWKKREQPSAAWAARYGKDFDRVKRFLAASQRWHKLKSIVKFLGFAAICMIAVGMTWLWYQAETERHKATSARLIAEAQLARDQGKDWLSRSALLSIEALHIYPEPSLAVNQILRESLDVLRKPEHVLHHDESEVGAVYSPDGALLATASWDKTARLWDTATGKELQRLSHDSSVYAVIFSPNGRQLATASDDTTVRIWDVATGQELRRMRHDDSVTALAFSPDGKRLATGSTDMTVRIWAVENGQEEHLLEHGSEVTDVAFSPDGKQLATASRNDTARIWDVASGKEVRSLSGHEYEVNTVAYSTDGRLATGGADGTVRLWDASTGIELQIPFRHDAAVNAVLFSPDGTWLATASDDFTARLWNSTTGKEEFQIPHDDKVNDIALSPDSKQIATASMDGTAQVWDTTEGTSLHKFHMDQQVTSVAFSPDGKQLATVSRSGTVNLWDLEVGQAFFNLHHDNIVLDIALSPDAKKLATTSADGTARVWDVSTGLLISRVNHRALTGIAFSPDGKQFATASKDKNVLLWEVATGKEKLHPLTHDGTITSLAFSPDGSTLATASEDKSARIWGVATGRQLHRFNHDASVTQAVFNTNGTLLATASDDNTGRLWDIATGRELHRFTHEANVNAVAFNPDGTRLATVSGTSFQSSDNTARIWDIASGRELHRLKHDNPVYAVAFSHDGKYLVTASDDSVYVWNTITGKKWRRLKHGEGNWLYNRLALSSDGKYIAAGATTEWGYSAETVVIWDLGTGKELHRLRHEHGINAVIFNPDGSRLATASWDSALLWLLQPDDMIAQVCTRLLNNLSLEEWLGYFEGERYRRTCENLPVHPSLLEKAKNLAHDGERAEATAMIREINSADPGLKLEPEAEIEKWTKQEEANRQAKAEAERARQAKAKTAERAWEENYKAKQLLKESKIEEAIAAFKRVEQIDPEVVSWNSLCWDGALAGFAAEVLEACEKAVKRNAQSLSPLWYSKDSRGLARALTGNIQGAIEDFEFVIKKTGDEKLKKQRRFWVQALRAGQNPFTEEELATLRNQ